MAFQALAPAADRLSLLGRAGVDDLVLLVPARGALHAAPHRPVPAAPNGISPATTGNKAPAASRISSAPSRGPPRPFLDASLGRLHHPRPGLRQARQDRLAERFRALDGRERAIALEGLEHGRQDLLAVEDAPAAHGPQRRRAIAQLGRKLLRRLVHVDPGADHQHVPRRAGTRLGEDPAELPPPVHHVVRPLDRELLAGRHAPRLDDRAGHRHPQERKSREREDPGAAAPRRAASARARPTTSGRDARARPSARRSRSRASGAPCIARRSTSSFVEPIVRTNSVGTPR